MSLDKDKLCSASGLGGPASTPSDARDDRQKTVAAWCAGAFGAEQAGSLPQRGVRLLEEAIEAYQAAGCDRTMAHLLVDFVFDRPPGRLGKEIGQVGVVLLAIAHAAGISADEEEAREVARVLAKPLAHYTARNAAKNAAGFLAAAGASVVPPEVRSTVGTSTECCTNCGQSFQASRLFRLTGESP